MNGSRDVDTAGKEEIKALSEDDENMLSTDLVTTLEFDSILRWHYA